MLPRNSLRNAGWLIVRLLEKRKWRAELQDLRRVLIDFRYRRLQQAIDKLNPSQEQIETWGKGHDRTHR
ncbi:MAG: hypothetical protein DYG98_16880 [Haliscomenobacteraceae bacterium CHB4]|nr:hypothetical protein [Haliscomenobacteraceae bacterium CHB4]